MANYSFNYGARFLLHDNEYIVRKDMNDNIEIENINYRKLELWSLNDLLNLWENGELVFRVIPGNEYELEIPDLDLIPEELMKIAYNRLNILKPVLNYEILPSELPEYLSSLHQKVSVPTFYNWMKQWKKSEDIRSLIPKNYLKGPKKRWSNEISLSKVDEVINDMMYDGVSHTIEALYSEYLIRIDEHNEILEQDKKINPVSFTTFYRRKKEITDIHRLETIKYGKVQADLNKNGSKNEVIATRPLERVEIDWTRADIMLVNPTTLKPQKPWLVFAVDKFSNHPLGFYVSFNDIDSKALKQCILHCLMPKTYIKDLYPGVENDWVAFGKPNNLIFDNSKVNESLDIEDICQQLGIEPQYCPIDSGYRKGTVERSFKTLNSKLIHGLKGTTFSNIMERQRYDSEGNACITMEGFIYMCHIAFVDMISHHFNKKVETTPNKKWLMGLKENPQIRPSVSRSKEELKLLLMSGIDKRTICSKGVVIQNEYYNSTELMDLFYNMKVDEIDKEKVRVRFDLNDMRSVYVFNKYKRKYIVAENTSLERKGIPILYPVHFSELEFESTIVNIEKDKVDKKLLGRSKRKIHQIQKKDEKKIKKLRNNLELSTTETSSKEAYSGISSIGISQIQLDLPEAVDSIKLLKDEKAETSTSKKNKKRSKQLSQPGESKFEEKNMPTNSFDIELDELPNWDVTYKGD